MADTGKDQFELFGAIAAALLAFLGGCRAMLHRRRKPPQLSEEQMIHMEARIIANLREQLEDQLSEQSANIRVLQADIIDLRGELRRRRER